MSAPRDSQTILAERLGTVLALAEANAEEARARAGLGGADIGRLSSEDGTARDIEDAASRHSAAEDRLSAARARIADLEGVLERLDQELVAAES